MGETKGYEVISEERKFTGEVFTVDLDVLRFPDGNTREREVVHHKGAVGVVALNEDGEVLLVSQYRHPMKKSLTEIPAGKLDGKESPYDCAVRELREETGAVSERGLEKLAEFYTTPGYSDEKFYLYFAGRCRMGERAPSDDEEEKDMGLLRVPLDDAVAMARNGGFEDGKTIVGILLAWMHLELGQEG